MGNGNTKGSQPLTGPKAKINGKSEETERVIEEITDVARGLWREYHRDFLSKDFCQNLAIKKAKELSGFSMKQLKEINNKIENSNTEEEFDVFLNYNPNHQEKFIVDELKEELQIYFKDKNVPLPTNGQLAYEGPEVKYMNYNDTNNYLMTGGDGGTVGGENLNSIRNAIAKRRQRVISNENTAKNINQNIRTFNRNRKKIEDRIDELSPDLIPPPPKSSKSSGPSGLSDSSSPSGPSGPKENKNKNRKGKRKEVSFGSFPDCDEKSCRLTKAELCRKIVMNYMMRANIVATIIAVIPRKRNGVLTGSFCFERYQALREGKFCLPPDYAILEKMNTTTQFKKLSKYINYFTEQNCNNVNGYWMELTEKQKGAVLSDRDEFNRYFVDYTAKLQIQYQRSILTLLDILKRLDEIKMVDNATLNELSLKCKEIIDSLYESCQNNYTYAMFAFIRADISTTPKMLEQEEDDIEILKRGYNKKPQEASS